jgi:hypothetical protein
MAGSSRTKDGVATARLCPAIHVFCAAKTWMPDTRPGMTKMWLRHKHPLRHFLDLDLVGIERQMAGDFRHRRERRLIGPD